MKPLRSQSDYFMKIIALFENAKIILRTGECD